MIHAVFEWVERGWVPDALVRQGIRTLLRRRLENGHRGDPEARREGVQRLVEEMAGAPLAVLPEKANEQHYEVPAEFFLEVLGKHLKYSSCLFPEGVHSLDEAEAAMLDLTCRRADLEDGQEVLELGCGWGSLSLWMAERYRGSRIVSVSNSASQRQFIEARAAERGLDNLRVITSDINDFQTDQRFDRVVSVEMFEHLRNWHELFRRVAEWLRPDGQLFFHVFCHRDYAYLFETEGAGNWMGRHFFTAGLMPSDSLPLYFQDRLLLERHWRVCGTHYQRTSRAWLDNLDARRERVQQLLDEVYGAGQGRRWVQRWRLFFMACEELFGYRGGNEWWVAHYRFRRRGDDS
jgi:cyclopropane-fatty-acyl-phospholipid synthase